MANWGEVGTFRVGIEVSGGTAGAKKIVYESSAININNGGLIVADTGAVTAGAATTGTTLTSKGYTALGDSNTGIKVKVITGTTNASEGGSTSVAHGLTASKIRGVQVLIFDTSSTALPPAYTISTGYEYNFVVGSVNLDIFNHPTNSENILSKTFYATITYVE